MDTTIPESRRERESHPVPVRCALEAAMHYKDAYTIGSKNAFCWRPRSLPIESGGARENDAAHSYNLQSRSNDEQQAGFPNCCG